MTSAPTEIRRRFFAPLRQGVEPGAHWIEYVARIGYLAQGVVYGLVGILAIQAAFSTTDSPDTSDALGAILGAPLGRFLLGLVALGLACYAVWRIVQAWWDTERQGREWKGISIRTGYALSSIAYVALAGAAGTAAIRGTAAEQGSTNREAAATVLAWPGGWILLVVAGLIVIGVGIVHFWNAYAANFMRDYEYTEMSDAERDWAKPIGRLGLTARGITFCLIGIFLALAGWRTSAGQVKGLGDAFNVLAAQPYGKILLALVATGFIAFGVFCLSQAKYRRIAKI